MFRRFRQWVAGTEISALAADLDKALDVNQAQAHRIEGLQLRLERLSNRVNMRLNRAGAPRDDERDEELMREMQQQRGREDEWGPPPTWN